MYPKRRVVLLNNTALNLMLQCFNIFFSNLQGTIVERRTLTKVEAAQTQLLASSDWHLHWCFARWLSGSLQARPLSELAKIYRPLEWSDIGTSARLAISMVKISEFQVVCEKLSESPSEVQLSWISRLISIQHLPVYEQEAHGFASQI